MMPRPATTSARRRIAVHGIVQGVGFRPFVYGQAVRCGLSGFVLNTAAGVVIEVEGSQAALESFHVALAHTAPPLARIDDIVSEMVCPQGATTFVIAESTAGAERSTLIAPDTATCADCLRELFDPADRRYGYPFINCTNCGPRFTIVTDVPYDRAVTTMCGFTMCAACHAEYDDPLDRRFHAQPNACPYCGPQVRFLDAAGTVVVTDDPIAAAAELLTRGGILAIKGLGGYHLACAADDAAATGRLRARKQRAAKPFALMAVDLATVAQLCAIDAAAAALLQSHRRPIVLLPRRSACRLPPAIAGSQTTLGVMLPYTPLHHLLLHAFAAGRGPEQPVVLVMTSGNRSDEPIAYRDDEAALQIGDIADGMLTHNRAIHMRCDDSVTRVVLGGEQLMRRSRGYAPAPIRLAFPAPVPVLACGGHLKNTFCLLKGEQAFVSQHIGDLENVETLTSYRAGIAHLQRLFAIQPQAVAHDLHPDYLATQYAFDCDPLPRIGVQHHHAHIASVLAEHHHPGPVIGVAADGSGYGSDGAIWGCEIMTADLLGFERLYHLRYVPLPGGAQAVRQPWRMAAVYLAQAYGAAFLDLGLPFVRQLDRPQWRTLAHMIERQVNVPATSSLGRLFDAVAALLGLHNEVEYEGQAAIALETVAARSDHAYPFTITVGRPATLDVAPMIRAIVADLMQGLPTAEIAGRFHCTIAALLGATCERVRAETGLETVALSGGVFMNRLLLEQLAARLAALHFQVLINRQVPCNDGGLSLGQAAVAAARLTGPA